MEQGRATDQGVASPLLWPWNFTPYSILSLPLHFPLMCIGQVWVLGEVVTRRSGSFLKGGKGSL